MTDELRDAAVMATVYQTIELRAKELKDQAKAVLAGMQPGDSIAARWDGETLGRATMTRGRTRLVVTDERAFVNWVAGNHPTEIVSQVNPAFVKSLEVRAKDLGLGAVIDGFGEVIPGVEIQEGDPYVSVRKEKDAPFRIAQLLSEGRISLDGITRPALPEPTDRYTQDQEAGAIG